MNDKNRAAFEAWFYEKYHNEESRRATLLRNLMFAAWQAARAQPIERAALIDTETHDLHDVASYLDFDEGFTASDLAARVRAIIAAQSTDAGNVSNKAKEIDRRPPCRNCMDTKIERGVYANTECQFCKDTPITKPLMAEAARDDVAGDGT